jgi:hypothetical protein
MNHPEVESLFKYKPVNQFTLDIIASDRIFYPKAESFNDPFDTRCSIKGNSAIVNSTDLAKIARAFPTENTSEMLAFTRKDMTKEIGSFNEKLKKFGILSLAEGPKDILMWSHYAEHHKGICIEFQRSKLDDLGDITKTRKVNYTKNYPSVSAKSLLNETDIEKTLMRVLYTKSEFWKYEQEWRMFVPEGNKVYRVPSKIQSITFGSRASQMDIDIVRRLVKGSDILLHQAQLKESEFGLKIIRDI